MSISFLGPITLLLATVRVWSVVWMLVTHAPIGQRSIVMRVSVCLCVCLSAIIPSELNVRSSSNLLRLLPAAVVRSSSGDEVIRYLLPVYG